MGRSLFLLFHLHNGAVAKGNISSAMVHISCEWFSFGVSVTGTACNIDIEIGHGDLGKVGCERKDRVS